LVCAAILVTGHEISVLNHCLPWHKLVDTHLYHSRQWFNIHTERVQALADVLRSGYVVMATKPVHRFCKSAQ